MMDDVDSQPVTHSSLERGLGFLLEVGGIDTRSPDWRSDSKFRALTLPMILKCLFEQTVKLT